MKKIVYLLVVVLIINVIVIDVVLFRPNEKLDEVYSEVFKDRMELKSGELVCVGTYMDKTNEKSDKVFIYNTKKYNFEIWYGNHTGNTIGTFTISNGNELNVVYSGMVLNEETRVYEPSDIKIKVLQSDDCSSIVIDGITYSKIED